MKAVVKELKAERKRLVKALTLVDRLLAGSGASGNGSRGAKRKARGTGGRAAKTASPAVKAAAREASDAVPIRNVAPSQFPKAMAAQKERKAAAKRPSVATAKPTVTRPAGTPVQPSAPKVGKPRPTRDEIDDLLDDK